MPGGALDVQAVFSSLCRCNFSGVAANCFAQTPTYLARAYGDYTRPSPAHASQKQMFDLVDDALI